MYPLIYCSIAPTKTALDSLTTEVRTTINISCRCFITHPRWNAARKRAYSSLRTSLNDRRAAGVTTVASSTTSIVSAPPTELRTGHIASSAAPIKITQAFADVVGKVFWRWQPRYLDNEWLALACAGHVEIKYPCALDSMMMPHIHVTCPEHNMIWWPNKTSGYLQQNLLQGSPLPNRTLRKVFIREVNLPATDTPLHTKLPLQVPQPCVHHCHNLVGRRVVGRRGCLPRRIRSRRWSRFPISQHAYTQGRKCLAHRYTQRTHTHYDLA